VLHCYLYS